LEVVDIQDGFVLLGCEDDASLAITGFNERGTVGCGAGLLERCQRCASLYIMEDYCA